MTSATDYNTGWEKGPLAQDGDRWALAVGLVTVVGLATLDVVWSEDRIISATVVIAPFFAALFGSPRDTAILCVAAIAACTLSGGWNHNYGTPDYVVRELVTIAGAGFAYLSSLSRLRLATDRLRFRLLSGAAAISDVATSAEDTVQRVCDLLVPAIADICVVDVVRAEKVERLAVAAVGQRAPEIEEGLRRRALRAAPPDGRVPAMRSGQAHLIERADEQRLRAAALDDEDLAFLRSLEGRSSVIVPLRARGRGIGSIALITTSAS